MPKLIYNYTAKVTFSERIHSHSYLLRFIPFENEAQHLVENHYEVLPQGVTNLGVDTFGNQIYTGYLDEYHHTLEFSSAGVVEAYEYILHEPLNPIYQFPSKCTKPLERIRQINKELDLGEQLSAHECATLISEKITSILQYEGGITGITTTAEEALSIGKGVCQDFAHIMIALCRLNKISARYVAGFIEGEGFTHAWVEYYTEGAWYGFDPTHNQKIDTGYIKVAQGRDYSDCPMDKGVFRGLALQILDVNVKVEHEQS